MTSSLVMKNVSISVPAKPIEFFFNTGSHCLLNSYSLVFPKKGIIGIFGKNGCGKTTLIRVLSGIYSYSGKIIKKNIIAVIDSNELLIPELTVEDNLYLFFKLSFFQCTKKQIKDILVFSGLR